MIPVAMVRGMNPGMMRGPMLRGRGLYIIIILILLSSSILYSI